ncbi:MAG TPA: LuxR C-terminal-related transcriptional regulator, partial [Ktedonobacteraceae bacterium]|nr:LuxR C-terminal-related transcriptional regulator [Ktedonobacteraceae bacterium]
QTFLLCTSILERLTAPLCDAVMEQTGSQQIFQQLERANLFVVSLDNRRRWYRYHALFAETLRHRLEQIHADLMPTLHHRASIWYAQHNQTTLAILHAFNAHQWQWAADLIERISVASLTWGASQYALVVLRDWLMQLPADIMHSRPRLCLIGAEMLWPITPQSILEVWIDTAEAMLITSLRQQPLEDASPMSLASQTKQDLENLLAEVFSFRAFMRCHEGDGPMVLALCQQALTLASAENFMAYSQVAWSRLMAYYYSVNDAVAAIENGLQTISLAQAAGQTLLAICHTGITVMHMIGTRRLHEAYRLTQQAIEQARLSNGLVLPDACWPTLLQAEILREWNELDAALALVEEAIPLCKQVTSHASFVYLLYGYAILLRILLSRGDLDAARNALQECEHIGTSINQSTYMVVGSFSIVIDQVRFWLAYGQLDDVRQLVEKLELGTTPIPFVHEREEVACARILLAKLQPAVALQRLKPVLQRATAGQRWGHVIEIRIVQALAYQILQQETQALDILSETIRLAEPEGYIRSFVDEGPPIEALLYQLRKQERKHGPTPYLDTVIAAFQQENMAHGQTGEPTKAQPLPKSLSERELEVLQLLAHGASNLEIAQELVIAVDTVKRHVRQILSKLGVKDRFQAARQAQALGLLSDK